MDPHTYVKSTAGAPYGFFEVEAAGLRWLADAGPGSAAIVAVHAVDADHIELDRVATTRPTRRAAEDFGRALARTHDAGAPAFGSPPAGWDGDGFIGTQPMTLRPTPRWGRFYAEQRMLPYAREAHAIGNLDDSDLATIEALAARLDDGVFDDDAPPSRLHGDLWAGNVMWSGQGVVLIDTAAQGGHALTDLGMLSLFGAPFLEETLAAYAAAAGDRLPQHWQDLIGLHQLHHLLVHAVTHSPSYGTQAARVARRYL